MRSSSGGASLILSLDAATDRPTLALGTPEKPGEDVTVASRRELSRRIERVAQELLEARHLVPRDLHGVVVADGPGSFTGLRIAIAFAKGLCRALDIPLFTAPSLMSAAWRAASSTPATATVLVAYDALRGDIYRAVYRFHISGEGALLPRVETLLAPELVRAEAPLPSPLSPLPSHPSPLTSHPSPLTHYASSSHASAATLLALTGVAGGAVLVTDPASFEPAYGRLAEAEARRVARHGPVAQP